jgi:hypothetical protein
MLSGGSLEGGDGVFRVIPFELDSAGSVACLDYQQGRLTPSLVKKRHPTGVK